MGSGKGKRNRVQSLSYPNLVMEDRAIWADFVRESGVEGVKMADYYSLPRPSPGTDGEHDAWREALATEFFRDLVGTGAIILPPHAAPVADFVFEVNRDIFDGVDSLYVYHAKGSDKILVMQFPRVIFSEGTTMGQTIWDVAQEMNNAVVKVVKSIAF